MKKILVADDNPAILDALRIMLEEEGYEVATTLDGVTKEDMRKYLPDLLLLDIWMSGVDGGDICKILKNASATKHVPIVLISAAKDIEQIAKDSGADNFIPKPFQMDNLLSTVAKYVYEY